VVTYDAKREAEAEKQKALEEDKKKQEELINQQEGTVNDFGGAQEKRNSENLQSQGDYNQSVDDAEETWKNAQAGNLDQSTSNTNALEGDFQKAQQGLEEEAKKQSADSNTVYKDLSTRQEGSMNQAQTNSQAAMTLKDYMDPNNAQMTGVRQLYDTRAQQERQRGLADYGVLSALGAQAGGLANQGPMTVGQQMANVAQSSRGAGEAYANTQRRMQALQDQGMERAFDQNDKFYNAGQEAQCTYTTPSITAMLSPTRTRERGQALRGERSGYQTNVAGSRQRAEANRFTNEGEKASNQRGVTTNKAGRALNTANSKYQMTSALANQMLGLKSGINDRRSGRSDMQYRPSHH